MRWRSSARTDWRASASLLQLLFLVLCLCACGARESDGTALSHQSLIGGIEDDYDPAVVLVIAQTADGKQELCTGTVIGHRTVLTAAHCVTPQVVGKDATFLLFPGSDFADPGARSRPEFLRTVERVDFDAEFEANLLQRGHDIAIVVAKEPLGIVPIAVSRQALLSGVQAVRIVGYGLASAQDTTGDTVGRRRQAEVPVLGVRQGSIEVGNAARGPCLGDSGGPALLLPEGETAERLVGVVSYSPRACNGGAVVIDTAAYLPLIDGWLATDSASPDSVGCNVAGPGSAGSAAHTLWPWLLLGVGILARRRMRPAMRKATDVSLLWSRAGDVPLARKCQFAWSPRRLAPGIFKRSVWVYNFVCSRAHLSVYLPS